MWTTSETLQACIRWRRWTFRRLRGRSLVAFGFEALGAGPGSPAAGGSSAAAPSPVAWAGDPASAAGPEGGAVPCACSGSTTTGATSIVAAVNWGPLGAESTCSSNGPSCNPDGVISAPGPSGIASP